MSVVDQLKDILEIQKETVSSLEKEIQSLSNSDLTKENILLREELHLLKEEYNKVKVALKEIKNENAKLKNALYEQIYSEKLTLMNLSAKKLDIYFANKQEEGLNKLSQLEQKVKARLSYIYEMLKNNYVDMSDEIYEQLENLSKSVNEKIAQARIEYTKMTGAFSENEKAEFEELKNEQITDTIIKKVAKKNNLEAFIGQNLINKIGIFLIIIGVITVSQFTYLKLPDPLKAIMIFAFGALMLVSGELLNRKKASIFSLGITAGGVAILYVALTFSYFGLKILSIYPAIALCILITTVSFILSLRYHSKTIASFALIGGYLPIFSISGNLAMIYGAMVYFMILNFLALSISFHKKWTICSYIGLFLNIAGTIYISSRMSLKIYNMSFGINHILLLLYITLAFLIYTAIPIVSTYNTYKKFKKSDVVLLGINTFVNAIIMYFVFYDFNLEKFTGVLAIIFAITYLLLGAFIDRKFKNEKHATALFYLTGFTFVVLIIPFQFGKTWLSLGWLIEGVSLTVYGILQDEKSFKKAGFVINALCVLAFLWVDILLGILWGFDYFFAYKYFAITLGSLLILAAYIYKNQQFEEFQKIYKYITLINFWIYTMYLSIKTESLLDKLLQNSSYYSDYLISCLIITVTYLIAYGLMRAKSISDTGTKIIAVIMYGFAAIWTLYSNTVFTPVNYTVNNLDATGAISPALLIKIVGTIVLILANLLAVFAVKDLLKYLVMAKKINIEWYPLLVSVFFVFLLTQNLTEQYNLEFSNIIISIIYAVTALAWISFGFIKKYTFIRRFGLGLAVLSVVKLFLIDLSYLKEGYKIIAYFALGISLIAISFVYQYFIKNLEIKENVLND